MNLDNALDVLNVNVVTYVLFVPSSRICFQMACVNHVHASGLVSYVPTLILYLCREHVCHARARAVFREPHENVWQCGAVLVFRNSSVNLESASDVLNVNVITVAELMWSWIRCLNAARRVANLVFLFVFLVIHISVAVWNYNASRVGMLPANVVSVAPDVRGQSLINIVFVIGALLANFVQYVDYLQQTYYQLQRAVYVIDLHCGVRSIHPRSNLTADFVGNTFRCMLDHVNIAR